MKKIIAITGGIGAGKSIVSRIVGSMGFKVYDCDSRAKTLMDSDDVIKNRLVHKIHNHAVDGEGNINRKLIAAIVFENPEKLAVLNEIVHEAVKTDIRLFVESVAREPVFVETAILYQSGIDLMVDEVWEVTAPESVRISRVMKRNGLTEHEVKVRINSQKYTPERIHNNVRFIVNDDTKPVLPQIERLINEVKKHFFHQ